MMETIIHSESKLKKCISCKEDKPRTAEHFYYRNKARGWFSSWCKPCRSEQREKTKEQELEAQRLRRGNKPRKAGVVKALLGCRGCGTTDKKTTLRYCSTCSETVKVDLKKKNKHEDKAIHRDRFRAAMPKWADKIKIKEFYKNRPEGDHVDHIIPLKGEFVSGLHVDYNLQYLTPEENRAKGNKQ